MANLLEQFGELIFTVNFLWVVIAATITMEVLKWTVLSAHINKRWYPLVVLGVVAVWVFLKTVVSGDWREIISNFIFTVVMADFIYTYLGQYIIKGILWLFKKLTGNTDAIDKEPEPKVNEPKP